MTDPTKASKKFCPSCGSETDINTRFCGHCTFDFMSSGVYRNTDSTPENNQGPSKNKLPFIIGGVAILGLILIIFVALAFVLYFNMNGRPGSVGFKDTPSPKPVIRETGTDEIDGDNENLEGDIDDEAYKEATSFWEARVATCEGNQYWAQQERGRPRQYALIFHECKNKPIIIVDGQAQTPRALSDADKLNGVDPLPVEWQGDVIATFETCRSDTLMDSGWSNWQNSLKIKSKLKKVKGEWVMDNITTGSYFTVDILEMDCKWVREYIEAQNLR